ncbi:MAG: DCC1-like thiol-disulfide oxidoreductase family protein [Sandaracinaceae bacterium]|nr:thiol-disulfide oxidoreductase [Myxococcales bacterium]
MQLEPRGPLPTVLGEPVLGEGESALLFDAECVVCSGWVHFVLRWDRAGALRIGAVQSEAGRALLEYAGLDPDDVDTMLLIERGVPYAKSSAFLRAVRFFRFPMNLLSVGLIVPRFLRDWLYDRVAKNRYSLFGKKELCLIPAPEERARFLPG